MSIQSDKLKVGERCGNTGAECDDGLKCQKPSFCFGKCGTCVQEVVLEEPKLEPKPEEPKPEPKPDQKPEPEPLPPQPLFSNLG